MKSDINKYTYLLCDCGLHIMQVNCHLEFEGNANELYTQEWNFAMFNYGQKNKPSLWNRIKIAWNYLKTGSMHNDQIVLNTGEADKLSKFIEDNNYAKCVKN